MRYSSIQIVFQEIPNEISLALHVTGCSLRCPGCHSNDLWNPLLGSELNLRTLSAEINKYRDYISCVLYLGGEWNKNELIEQLKYVKSCGLKTALYSGLEYRQIDCEIKKQLDYLKYGKYDASLGPLTSIKTNQKLVNLNTNENLNHYFIHGG